MPVMGKNAIVKKEKKDNEKKKIKDKLDEVYGKSISLGDQKLNYYKTGNESIDKILIKFESGINVIYGGFSSGKTTACEMFGIDAISRGDDVNYIDSEDAIRKERVYAMGEKHGVSEEDINKHFHLILIREWDDLKEKLLSEIIPNTEHSLLIIDGLSTPYMKAFRNSDNRFDLGNEKDDFLHDLESAVFARDIVCIITIQPKSDLTIIDEIKKRKEGSYEKDSEGKKTKLSKVEEEYYSGGIMLFKHGANLGFTAKIILRFVKKPKERYFYIEKHSYVSDFSISKEKYSITIDDGGITKI